MKTMLKCFTAVVAISSVLPTTLASAQANSSPRLGVRWNGAQSVTLIWSNVPPGFVLQQANGLSEGALWKGVLQSPQLQAGNAYLTRDVGTPSAFFRLVRKGIPAATDYLLGEQVLSGGWGLPGQPTARDTGIALETLKLLGRTNTPYPQAERVLDVLVPRDNFELARKILALAAAGQDVSGLVDELVYRQATEIDALSDPQYPGRNWGFTRRESGNPLHTALGLRALRAGGKSAALCVARETLPASGASVPRQFLVSACATNVLLKVRSVSGGTVRITLSPPSGSGGYYDFAPSTTPVTIFGWPLVPGNWTVLAENMSGSPVTYTAEVGYGLADGSDTFRLTAPLVFLGLKQNPDGGWPAVLGQASDLPATAEVVQLLAQVGQEFGPAQMLTLATSWLLNHRNADGGFSTAPNNSNPTETSLAFLALRAANAANGLTNTVVYLRNAQQPDGSWNTNVYDTALAMQAIYLPPVVGPIPDQSVAPPNLFLPIALDERVVDLDHADNELAWQVTGATRLGVNVSNRVVRLSYPSGTNFAETLTFTATDPDGFAGNASALFSVGTAQADFTIPRGGSVTGSRIISGPANVMSQVASYNDGGRIVPTGLNYTWTGAAWASATDLRFDFRIDVAGNAPLGLQSLWITNLLYDSSGHVLGPLTSNVFIVRVNVGGITSNRPPLIVSTAPTVANVGQLYTFTARSTDPDGDPIVWDFSAHPAGMSLHPNLGTVCWMPAANQVGTNPIVLCASDGRGGVATQSFNVVVSQLNRRPVIGAIPNMVVYAGFPYQQGVTASDPDSDPLSFGINGPPGMNINAQGLITWSASITNVGTNTITVSVADSPGAVAEQDYTLIVKADTTPPQMGIICPPDQLQLGTILDINAFPSDVTGIRLFTVSSNDVTIPIINNHGEITLDNPGPLRITARAIDWGGNVAEQTCVIRVFDVEHDPNGPQVAISSPANEAIVSKPINVVGTVTDASLVFYKLEVGLASDGEFHEIGRGSNTVVNGVLGRLDPSTLVNDYYTLRLTATDADYNQSMLELNFSVTGELKLGNFRLSFTDLSIPVNGVPIIVGRAYDSLTAGTSGDFGFGWRMEFKDAQVRSSLPKTSPDEQEVGIFNPFRQGSRVFVTVPGGKRESFTFRPQRKGGFAGYFAFYDPAFAPDLGTSSRLCVPSDHPIVLIPNDYGEYLAITGGGGTMAYNPEDPNLGGEYLLTTKDGLTYAINAGSSQTRIVADPNNNTLTFATDAIISSTGVRVSMSRDAQGRITSVTDPRGRQVRYQYSVGGDLASVTDRGSNVTQFIYSTNRPHYLVQVIDPLGRSGVRTEYDEQGRLITMRDAAGNPVQLLHNSDANMEQVVDALGKTNSFVYDDRGNVVTEVNAAGAVTRREYDLNNNVTVEVDPLGKTNRFNYDGNGNLLQRTDPLGNTTWNTYQEFRPGLFDRVRGAQTYQRLKTTTDPLGNTVTNNYDGAGNLTATTDSAGNTTRYTYDSAGNQTSIVDPQGNTNRFEYNGAGHLLRQTDALGNVTTYTYDGNGNQLSQTTVVTVRPGEVRTNTTFTTYDANSRPTSATDAAGNITRTEYDALGNTKATLDALGHRTEFHYDDRGKLTNTVFADGTSSSLAYDAAGRRTSSTDRAGRTTYYGYDALGRLTNTLYPAAAVFPRPLGGEGQGDGVQASTSTIYDFAGRVIAQIDERGNRTSFAYDAAGRQVAVTNALGHVTRSAYDAAGRKTTDTDALGRTTQFIHDAVGRRIQTLFADGTAKHTLYDVLGRVFAEIDQAGVTNRFEYDALGRLTAVIDALGHRTEYAYNETGNLVRQQDANGHVTRYEYETCCHRSSTILPLGQRSTTIYNAVNNVAFVTNFNNQVIAYDYDVNNRLALKSLPGGASVRYGYTPTGRRAAITNSAGVTTWTYDNRDRLILRTDPDGRAVAYTYDVAGNRTAVLTGFPRPLGGGEGQGEGALLSVTNSITRYSFDALNRLETVADAGGTNRYTYDPANNLAIVRLANGTSRTNFYDDLNRMTDIFHAGPTGVFASFRYTLAPTGNRRSVHDLTGRTVAWDYDALNRLTRETVTSDSAGQNYTGDYVYDAVGNRLYFTNSLEGMTAYQYDDNDQLLTEVLRVNAGVGFPRPLGGGEGQGEGATSNTGTTHYIYDANGNTLCKSNANESAVYDWTAENRLIAATVTTNGIPHQLAYAYDDDGIRMAASVTETGSTTATAYLVDANRPFAQVLEEWTSLNSQPSTLNSSYTYGHQLLSQNRAGVRTYYHADHLGSTRALTGEAGSPTDRYAFDAYGRTLRQTGPTANDYLFAGEQRDRQLGLDYLRARYLNVGAGRFYAGDPVVGEQTMPITKNPFLYAGSDPVNKVDPTGQFFIYIQTVVALAAYPDVIKPYADRSAMFAKWAGRQGFFQGVFLQGHPVAYPYMHLSLKIVPKNQSKWLALRQADFRPNWDRFDHFATIGAGPDAPAWLAGNLVSGINRDTDVHSAKFFVARLSEAVYQDQDQMIEALFRLNDNYGNNLEYTTFPDGREGYNSNSYIAGLLEAAGIPLPGIVQLYDLPGVGKPVPASYFR